MRIALQLFGLRAAVLCTVAALSGCAASFNPTELTVYHGLGSSQAVAYEIGNHGRAITTQRTLEFELPEGTRVCMNVLNAHTPGFTYSLKASVDSTPPTAPDFGTVLTLLNTAITAPTAAGGEGSFKTTRTEGLLGLMATGVPATDQSRIERVVTAYQAQLLPLTSELNDANVAIRKSFDPEALLGSEVRVAIGEERGLAYAKSMISGFPTDPGHFNDPALEQTLATWRQEAAGALGTKASPTDLEFVDLVHSRALTLLAARNAIRDTYSRASLNWRECQALGRGKTTLNLIAQSRNPSQSLTARDTGSIVQLTAFSKFQRNVVEIVPLAFVSFPRNVTGFAVVNDSVREDKKYADSGSFRVGTMLTTTPLRFGPTDEWAFGPGIGTGLIGGDKPALSDFFLGGLVSWRDWFRVGVGYGFSQAPGRLINGAQVGRPLPLGDGRDKLSDFVQTKRVGTLFLTFTLTGLKLKN